MPPSITRPLARTGLTGPRRGSADSTSHTRLPLPIAEQQRRAFCETTPRRNWDCKPARSKRSWGSKSSRSYMATQRKSLFPTPAATWRSRSTAPASGAIRTAGDRGASRARDERQRARTPAAHRATPAQGRQPDRADRRRRRCAGLGGPEPAPATPYNADEVGPDRRFTWTRVSLDDVKAIKNTLGGTVNDVVLTVVTLALRRHLMRRGEDINELELKAFVPVSVRTEDHRGTPGNQVSGMLATLPGL